MERRWRNVPHVTTHVLWMTCNWDEFWSAAQHVYVSDDCNRRLAPGTRWHLSDRYSLPTFSHNNLITVPLLRHAGSTVSRTLVFGSLNIRLLSPLKHDSHLVEIRNYSLEVLVLCEMWHDSDSVSISRLFADGFSVVERARSWRLPNSLSTNHGGIVVVAAAGVRLTSADVGAQPSTFEFVAACVGSDSVSCIVVALYHLGSSAVTTSFFSALADLLDHLSTYAEPIELTGDISIQLERVGAPSAVEFLDLLALFMHYL